MVVAPITASADAGTDVDANDWLTAHRAKPPGDLRDPCCCVELTVGTSAEPALHCRDASDVAVTESATIAIRDVIWVVRGGKAVTVLDRWTELQNMDHSPGTPSIVALRLTFDESRKTITIVDPGTSMNRCAGLRKPRATDTADERTYRQWIDRICAARGTYRWRGKRFR